MSEEFNKREYKLLEKAIIEYSKESGIEIFMLHSYLTDGRLRGIISKIIKFKDQRKNRKVIDAYNKEYNKSKSKVVIYDEANIKKSD